MKSDKRIGELLELKRMEAEDLARALPQRIAVLRRNVKLARRAHADCVAAVAGARRWVDVTKVSLEPGRMYCVWPVLEVVAPPPKAGCQRKRFRSTAGPLFARWTERGWEPGVTGIAFKKTLLILT